MSTFSAPHSSPSLAASLARKFLRRDRLGGTRVQPIIVHSHLSWDNVWQRPQQFLSRLAHWHPVLFVETEVRDGSFEAFYEHKLAAGCPRVRQLKIIFPRVTWENGSYVDHERRRLLKAALLQPVLRKYQRPIQWFYDPMAVSAFLGQIDESLVVYDCMDELSQFRGAPLEMVQREQELLSQADLVFCGGNRLHQVKKVFHSDCHFYGCGVDIEHFSLALQRSTLVPEDIRGLPKPVYGYYGVVDERLDYNLLFKLAQSTRGSVVVIGPTAKVNPDDLPSHPKLHWLGRREYSDLPCYAKGFDVCLMPFALNESTEFINPTKALEYLASGRPVVSTKIADVVSLFSAAVSIAASSEEFTHLCQQQSESPSRQMRRAGLRLASARTWDRLAIEIEGHLCRKETDLAKVSSAGLVAAISVEPRLT